MPPPREVILELWGCAEEDLPPSQKVNLARAVRRYERWGSVVESIRKRRPLPSEERDSLRQDVLTWIRIHVPDHLVRVLAAEQLAARLLDALVLRIHHYRYERDFWVWSSPFLRAAVVSQEEIFKHVAQHVNVAQLKSDIDTCSRRICSGLLREFGINVRSDGAAAYVLFKMVCTDLAQWPQPYELVLDWAQNLVKDRVKLVVSAAPGVAVSSKSKQAGQTVDFVVGSRGRPVDPEKLEDHPARKQQEETKIRKALEVFVDTCRIPRAKALKNRESPRPPSGSEDLRSRLDDWDKELRVETAIWYMVLSGNRQARELVEKVKQQVLDEIAGTDLEFEEKLADAKILYVELLLAEGFPLYSAALNKLGQPRRRGGLNEREAAAIWLQWSHTEMGARSGLWHLYWTSQCHGVLALPRVIQDVFNPLGEDGEDEHYIKASRMTLNAVANGCQLGSVKDIQKCLAHLLSSPGRVLTVKEQRLLRPLLDKYAASPAGDACKKELTSSCPVEPFGDKDRKKIIAWIVETCVKGKDPRQVATSLRGANCKEITHIDVDILRAGNTLRDQFVRAVFQAIDTY